MKDDNTFSIVYRNVNTMPTYNHNYKNGRLKQFILTHDYDIVGLSEMNKHWYKVPSDNQPHQCLHTWLENSYIKYAFNHAVPPEGYFQLDGVLQISLSSAANQVYQKSGEDTTGFGQWAWTRYLGKNRMILRVVTVYRPCTSSQIAINSTYTQ